MKKLSMFIIAFIIAMNAIAQDFEVDGIFYRVVDGGVKVTRWNYEYEDEIVLHGTVEYEGQVYPVLEIGESGFCRTLVYGQFFPFPCKKLTTVDDLPYCKSIGAYAFEGCNSLTTIGDLSACTTIGGNAFGQCISLTTIGNLSACTSIGESAFDHCYGLTNLSLPVCTAVGNNAFNGIEYVNLPATPPSGFGGVCDNGTTFLVPDEAVETYRSTDYWKDIKMQVIGQNAQHNWDVNAPVLDGIGKNNLNNVMTLKVTGDIDSEDIMFIRNNMLNLHHLDLTDANFKSNTQQEYASGRYTNENSAGGLYSLNRLRSVKLPKSAKSIEGDALQGCCYLKSVIIPEGIEQIDDGGAFIGTVITSVSLPSSLSYIGRTSFSGLPLTSIDFHSGLETIGEIAFSVCEHLESIVFPEGLQTIGSSAFSNCSQLQSIFLPKGLKTIGSGAFNNCGKLKNAAFPSTLEKIEGSAFEKCNLQSLSLPTSLTYIGSSAFASNVELQELRIPASVEEIAEQAFTGCDNLKDVYTYVVDPITINTNTFSTYTAATLHIPEQSENAYFRNAQWGQFPIMTSFNEPYSYFYVSNDYTLPEGQRFEAEDEEEGIAYQGNAGSSITIEGEGDQELGEMDIYDDGTSIGSVMADENLKARGVTFHLQVRANQWRFFCFPFRVQLCNVEAPGEYVFRRYDGALRALMGASGWAELEEGTEWLEPGEGYIFQCTNSGVLKIRVECPDFYWHGSNKHNSLLAHVAQNAQHASWNFIGNIMTSYYDINDLSYSAPLTIWNGSSYTAYRPGDDNYQLSPFEAFFVQKPDNDEEPTYEKGHRMGYHGAQHAHANRARRPIEVQKDRQLLNLSLSDGVNADKTRVVFNAKQSQAYEKECDAAKFMSGDVPQLYTIEQQVRYAINERPQGSVMLGFTAPAAGSYTINMERMDTPVVLKDLLMGTTHNFENGEYSFNTEVGTWENRFMLMPLSTEATAISTVDSNSDSAISVYSIDGRQLPQSDLPQGVVVMKQNNRTKKVVKH